MNKQRPGSWAQGLLILLTTGLLASSAWADFELRDSKGRRIRLLDNGTWRYVDAKDREAAASEAKEAAANPPAQAELRLERRVEAPGGCRFDLALSNTLAYEIRSLVPDFAAQRANGVIYATQIAGFGSVMPGDQRRRSLQFAGIGCTDIARLEVRGGDRCEMGDLNKFTDGSGLCMARVRVLPSELLVFEKQPAETK